VARGIDLVHVHVRALKDPVPLSSVTADNFEVTVNIELGALCCGQPFPQQLYTPGLAVISKNTAQPLAPASSARAKVRGKPSEKERHGYF
jgi:hypothetical protein